MTERFVTLTLISPPGKAMGTVLAGPAKMLVLNTRHIVSVIGTSEAPDAGDTGAIVTLVTGAEHHVVQSASAIRDKLKEANA